MITEYENIAYSSTIITAYCSFIHWRLGSIFGQISWYELYLYFVYLYNKQCQAIVLRQFCRESIKFSVFK